MPIFDKQHSNLSTYGVLYGGSGEIRFKDFFTGESNLPVRLQYWQIPPGGSEGMHRHDGEENLEEIYLILAGTARFESTRASRELLPGDAVLVPPDEDHSLINTGEETLELIMLYGKATGPHVPV